MLKQMKLIYATGFSKTEKLEWKPVVFNNIVQSFRMIHDAMKELDIAFEKPESEVRTNIVSIAPFGHNTNTLPTIIHTFNCSTPPK